MTELVSNVLAGAGAPARPRPWRLSRLAVAVLAGWLTLDVGLRLLPVERLGVSAITAAHRFTGRYSPFRANLSIVIPAGSPGENAVRGNLPPTELRPPLRFSTDHLGYRRNPEMPPGATPDVLFLGGDSFIYGANLSDEETLPAAFTRASGLLAYNGARSHLTPMTLTDLDWLLNQLPQVPTSAVLVHLEQHRRGRDARPRPITALDHNIRYARWLVKSWWDASPLSNATRRLFRRLSNDRLLTNVYEQQVVAHALPDGRSMLFRESETYPARIPQTPEEIRTTSEYIEAWTQEIHRRGMQAHVLLLPTRFTLYGPWLVHPERRAGVLRAVDDFYALEAELRKRGIRTINGLEIFRQTAVIDLASRELPFYREDNHWAPEGVNRIARALADSLKPDLIRPGQERSASASR
jgi:SGNH hydrolase-like domain, acetyltransferase AlgX